MFEELDTLYNAAPHQMRPCMMRHSHDAAHESRSLINYQAGASPMRRSVDEVAAEKLLEASLISLEAIGRQRASGVSRALSADSSQSGSHPNESYLLGAIWLGRNMMMVAEELADSLDLFRNKQLVEVAAAAQDADAKRSAHRLNLLAAAGITEAVALANTSKSRARQIFQVRYQPSFLADSSSCYTRLLTSICLSHLQLLSAIQPGDKASLEVLQRILPIDSAIHQAAHTESPRSLRRHNAPPVPY